MKDRLQFAMALMLALSWLVSMTTGLQAQAPATPADEPDQSEVAITPVVPSITQASCIDGTLIPPSLVPQETAGITYVVVGDVAAGNSILVIATLLDGYRWNDVLTGNWVLQPDNTASYPVVLESVTCAVQEPPTPEITPTEPDLAARAGSPTPTSEPDEFSAAQVPCDVGHVGVLIDGNISNLVMSPNPPTTQQGAMSFNFDWAVSDSAQIGDFFTITLPSQLTFVNTLSFPLTAPGDPGTIVATGSILSGVMTITLTDYVCENLNVNGNAFVQGFWKVSDQTVNVVFTTNSGSSIGVAGVVIPAAPPSPPGPSGISKLSAWFDPSDQGVTNPVNSIFWQITGPFAGPEGIDVLTITDTAGDNWVFDCSYNPAGTFGISGFAPVSKVCSPTSLTVTWENVPEGRQPWVQVGTTILHQEGPWQNTATVAVTIDGNTTTGTPSNTRTRSGGAGGSGSGTVLLRTPTIVQASCINGSVVNPTITLPANSAGVTYSQSGSAVPGGTVTVTATLNAGYAFPVPLPAGWSNATSTTATYVINLDDSGCTPVVPVSPAITQASCIGGMLINPVVIPAASGGGITYFTSGTVAPGSTVSVAAILDNGYEWGTLLPGWVEDNATTAVFTFTLDDVECTQVAPVAPTVVQSACVGGVLTTPSVTLAPNGGGITYSSSGTVAAGQVVVVTATLADGFAWPDTMPPGWLESSNTTATYTVTLTVATCIEVNPVAPTVVQAACVDGQVTTPSVTPAANGGGILYVLTGDVLPGETVVVTANLARGYGWPNTLPPGWTETSNSSATYTVTLIVATCTESSPVAPSVVQAACIGGQVTAPSVTPAANGGGITYILTGNVVPGETVVITATLAGGNAWPEVMPGGWTETSPTTATYTVTLADPACTVATLAEPTIVQAACLAGELSAPSVTPAANGGGITYTRTGSDVPGETVVVTATLGNGYEWPTTLPTGWVETSLTTATYSTTLDDVECTQVIPVDPTIVQETCVGGQIVAPSVVAAENSEAIIYTLTGAVAPGEEVVITATLTDGYEWPTTLPTGWVETSPATATYAITLDDVSCVPAVPVDPEVVQEACVGGQLSAPSVTAATNSEAIAYVVTGTIAPGEEVVITATLADGYEWPTTPPTGWTETSPTTATYAVTLDDVDCTPVAPIAPDVIQEACIGGELIAPSVTLAEDTDAITYTISGAATPGTTIVVTATLADGYEWDTLGAQWIEMSLTTATYSISLDDVDCVQIVPPDPIVTEANCLEGVVSTPIVTPVEQEGIIYTISDTPTPGATITVTATLSNGVAWAEEMPESWTVTSPTTATFSVTLDDVECSPVAPVEPEVIQATCIGGVVTQPVIIPALSDGISYSLDGEQIPGGTVVLTATLLDGYGWAEELPEAWTIVSPTSATTSLTLDDASCLPATPQSPEVIQATCLDGTLTPPSVTLAETAGLTYILAGSEVPGTTVIVTATLKDGYSWPDTLPEGWEQTSATTATWSLQLDPIECVEVLPVDPTVVPADCTITPPSVTLPSNTDAITYGKSGDEIAGGTVTITATLSDGFNWPTTLPDGWTLVDDTTATFVVNFPPAEIPCESPDATPVPVDPGKTISGLPNTGSGQVTSDTNMVPLIAAMLLVVVAGMIGWRRRNI